MTINPQQPAVSVGELGTRADRPTPSEPRRNGTAPPSGVVDDDATKRAQGNDPQAQDATVAETAATFPMQELSIRKDPDIGRVIVQVLDSRTGEVVRQIPSEEWVRILKRLHGAKGLFVDRKG